MGNKWPQTYKLSISKFPCSFRNHTAPFYFTKCLRLRQCPVLLEEWKAGRKMSVCLHSTEISEMLVCCTHEQYIQSKIFLMNRPQKITYKANYLDFKNCLRRQAEFSSDEFESKLISKSCKIMEFTI